MLENKEKDVKHSLPILFVSSEATPFAPNGDLAAKVTNLATNIAKQPENHFVAVVIPGYKQYMDEFKGQLKYIYSFQLSYLEEFLQQLGQRKIPLLPELNYSFQK